MIKRDFPSLDEHCFDERLENGLLVRVIPKPGFARTYAFLAVDFGSVDTAFRAGGREFRTPDGVAHYLEHKMFDLPDGSAMDEFARWGGSNNAFTNYTMTAYYVECTEHFRENLNVLLRMVTTPCFTDESVEKERGIIAQEIRMYEDSADSAVFENLFSALYRYHPARVPIAGTVESIGRITAGTLREIYDAFYRPENMMLCVMGDVDTETVVRAVREDAGSGEPGQPVARDYGPAEPMTGHAARTEAVMEVSMPTFVLGFKCPPAAPGAETARQEIVGDLAAEMLVGESSALYEKLYEQNRIDSDFSAGFERMKGLSLLEAAGDSEDPDGVADEILAEAERLCRGGLDPVQFERLKKSALGRRTRDIDSFESTCYRVCAAHFDGTEYFDYPEAYRAVTLEDVTEFLRRTVVRERMSISVIRPKKEA